MQGRSGCHPGANMASTALYAAIIGNVVGRLGTKGASPSQCRGVAAVAVVGRSDMARALAHRLDAVMARHARAKRAVCICCGEPPKYFMAVAAWVGTLDGCRTMACWLSDRGDAIVAARADSGSVVFVLGGKPADKTMAVVTLICGLGNRVMGRRFTDCRVAVVASCASAGSDAGVIPRRGAPCNAPVALIARRRRFLSGAVACRLGRGLPAVMTGCALPGFCCAMVETRSQPGGGIKVAVFAWCVSHDMIVGFRRCHDALADCMTTIATLRSAFENPSDMAGFAGCGGMSAGKRKSGTHVVEITPTRLRFGYSLQRGHG